MGYLDEINARLRHAQLSDNCCGWPSVMSFSTKPLLLLSRREAWTVPALHLFPHLSQANLMRAPRRLCMSFPSPDGPCLHTVHVSIHVDGYVSTLGIRSIYPFETEGVPVSCPPSNPGCFPFVFWEKRPSRRPRTEPRDGEPSQ